MLVALCCFGKVRCLTFTSLPFWAGLCPMAPLALLLEWLDPVRLWCAFCLERPFMCSRHAEHLRLKCDVALVLQGDALYVDMRL